MERGTLYQLRNLINRRNVVKNVKTDMNVCEDFFELIVTGHIVTCAMEFLGMSTPDESPSRFGVLPVDAWIKDDNERKQLLMDVASHIVEHNVNLSTSFCDSTFSELPSAFDSVFSYSCETLSLGLLYLEFKDSIKEGDGDRVMRVRKYFFLLFKVSGRKNYAIEAFTLLSQYHLILPPRLAEQVKWCRFINTQGLPGHNISCDLHLEHLNRVAKIAIDGLGSNKTDKAIQRIGRAVGTVKDTLINFDSINEVCHESGAHSTRSNKPDLKKVINELVKSEVFSIKPGRKHKSFSNLQTNYIRSLPEKSLKDWMIDHYATVHFDSKL